MAGYRVRFLNRLTNSYGRTFEVCQRQVQVSAQDGSEAAIELAKEEFCRAERIRDWRNRATTIECVEVNPNELAIQTASSQSRAMA